MFIGAAASSVFCFIYTIEFFHFLPKNGIDNQYFSTLKGTVSDVLYHLLLVSNGDSYLAKVRFLTRPRSRMGKESQLTNFRRRR